MVSNLLMYVMLAISGILGTAIAWDDLFTSKTNKEFSEQDAEELPSE